MLKLPQVAHRLGVSERTARRYIKAGEIPSVFIGNAYRVREEDVEEYMRQAQVTPEGAVVPKVAAPPSLTTWLEERCGHAYLALPKDEFEEMFDRLPEESPERREIALKVNREYNVFCKFPSNVTTAERVAMRRMIRDAIPQVAVKHGIALMEGGLHREYLEEAARIFEVERATESDTA